MEEILFLGSSLFIQRLQILPINEEFLLSGKLTNK